MKYNNPIIPGFYPDPSICRVGKDFYLVTSSFEYFPGVPIFHSRDLVNWRQIGHCLTRSSQLSLEGSWASGGIWAPTLRYHNNTFYMTTTNTTSSGHFFVTAKDPAGEWSEPIWVAGAGFDPSFFFDQDGRVYFHWYDHTAGILQTEIDLLTGEHTSVPRILWHGTGARSPEGPHLYKFFGRYYLMVAEGGTEDGHMISIARGDTPWGPWEACPFNPILSHRSLDHPIQTTGHGDIIQASDGSWWIVFLGTRPVGYPRYHMLGRETFLAPIIWQDSWPIVGNKGRIELEMEASLPPAHPWSEIEALQDDFDSASFGLHWNWLRNPSLDRYALTERKGWLRLVGSAINLEEGSSPTFIGRRQRHLHCRATTKVDFNPQADNEEAGLVALADNHHHYEIGIRLEGAIRSIFVRRKIGSLQAVVAQQPLPEGLVTLSLEADESWYTFLYAVKDNPPIELARGETRYLCTESGAAMFTATYFGLYATGNGTSCQTPADFDWFRYEILGAEA
jgi:alpha-N-arabinofuranosidase